MIKRIITRQNVVVLSTKKIHIGKEDITFTEDEVLQGIAYPIFKVGMAYYLKEISEKAAQKETEGLISAVVMVDKTKED